MLPWIPAFAGMTGQGAGGYASHPHPNLLPSREKGPDRLRGNAGGCFRSGQGPKTFKSRSFPLISAHSCRRCWRWGRERFFRILASFGLVWYTLTLALSQRARGAYVSDVEGCSGVARSGKLLIRFHLLPFRSIPCRLRGDRMRGSRLRRNDGNRTLKRRIQPM